MSDQNQQKGSAMKGILEVCYHNEDETQASKRLTTINTENESKSFHLNIDLGDKKLLISIYSEGVAISDITEEEKLLYLYATDEDDEESANISLNDKD